MFRKPGFFTTYVIRKTLESDNLGKREKKKKEKELQTYLLLLPPLPAACLWWSLRSVRWKRTGSRWPGPETGRGRSRVRPAMKPYSPNKNKARPGTTGVEGLTNLALTRKVRKSPRSLSWPVNSSPRNRRLVWNPLEASETRSRFCGWHAHSANSSANTSWPSARRNSSRRANRRTLFRGPYVG